MGERRPFVIVGAGIGGLSAALALAEKGLPPIVCERATELSEVGAGIQLAPNAGRVLAALGLDEAIADCAIEPAAIDLMSGRNGGRLTTLPAATFRSTYGFPYRVVHRADLQAVLVAAASRRGIRVELGATVESFAATTGGLRVRIRTPSGSETVDAEAVIAADGVWSTFRDRIPGAGRASATGRTAWRAMIPATEAVDVAAMDRVALWLGPRAHLVHYPVARGAAVNVVAIVEDSWNQPGWSTAGDRRDLAPHFAEWSPQARRVLDTPIAWQKFAIAAVDPSGAWLDGRLVLLGDAAHAMPPFLAQGAAMAIEDAAVLADALAGSADTAEALRAYVALRQPRTVGLSRASHRAGERFHMSGVAAIARDFALRIAGERLILGQNDAIYRWRLPGETATARAAATPS
jgi:salicylate hydroxylase